MQKDRFGALPSRAIPCLPILFAGIYAPVLFGIAPQTQNPVWLVYLLRLFGIALIIAAMVVAMHFFLLRIEGNAGGLRRRRFFTWEARAWSEVVDYSRSGSQSARTAWYSLRFADGSVWKFDRDWVQSAQLREVVEESAPVAERIGSWAVVGMRPCDQPQTFAYTHASWRSFWLSLVSITSLFAVLFAASWLVTYPALKEGKYRALFLPLGCLGFGCLMGVLGRPDLVNYHAMRSRKAQSYQTNEEGFTFSTGKESVFVPWGDVIGYDFSTSKNNVEVSLRRPPAALHRLRTEQGQSFDFVTSLDRNRIFEEIVRRCATNSHEAKIDRNSREAIGGVAAQWTGGVEGKGDRVFPAWTRTNRMMAFVFPGMGIVFAVMETVVYYLDLSTERSVGIPGNITIALGSILAAVLIRKLVQSIRVEMGANSLQFLQVWKRTVVPYDDIDRWACEGSELTIYCHTRSPLKIATVNLTNGSQIEPLLAEKLRLIKHNLPSHGASHADR